MADPYRPDPSNHVAPSPRWVRAFLGGRAVVDSRRTLLLREPGRLPRYVFPADDVDSAALAQAGLGDACEEVAIDGGGYLAVDWKAVDAWFEEDEQVFVHPRDPFKRVDALRSSRHVRVVLGGETVAETRRPVLLFETGLLTRYYLPPLDVRRELLRPSDKRTRCPYKGEAAYHTVEVAGRRFEDVVWTYRYPLQAVEEIRGLLCFFNEKVDAIFVDGQEEAPPQTPWS